MDISEIKPVEVTVDIKHPKTNDELGIKVSLMSVDDPRMRKVMRAIRDRNRQQEARGKAVKSEEVEETTNNLIFSAMTGWIWEKDATFHGKKPDFDRNHVIAVFNELPWFRDQLDEVLGDEKRFY